MRLQELIPPPGRIRCQAVGLATLLPVFAAVYFSTYWLRFDGVPGPPEAAVFWATVTWVVAAKAVAFTWFRAFQVWERLVTFHDLVALVKAATCGSLLMVLVDYLVLPHLAVPRSIFLLDWGATIVAVGGLRAVVRVLQDGEGLFLLHRGQTAIFIIGANETGELLLRAIKRQRNKAPGYHVVGFLADGPDGVGKRIGGVPVVGTVDQMCQLARRYGVREVLITAGRISGKSVRRLVDQGRQHALRVRVVPSYEQLLDDRVAVEARPVAIEDLLRREPVQLDMERIGQWIGQRVVLVTGSAGSIGSEICRRVLRLSPARLVLVDRSENGQFYLEQELRTLARDTPIDVQIGDVTDVLRMDRIFRTFRPDIVFHAAAYKHVPLMESNAGEAAKNIALATRLLADLAIQHQVRSFVMISTDKAVNPSSAMGMCKRIAEHYVRSLAGTSPTRLVVVRFGNVLDSEGSVIPIFRAQIARGGPITVTHPEMTRYFMTIPEASQLVLEAGAMGQGGEIFVLDMGQPVRIVDLARDMIRLSGLVEGEDIEIEFMGMRPGEKLHESLHASGELRLPTCHPKIVVAQSDRIEFDTMLNRMTALERVCNQPNDVVMAELMRHQVPVGLPGRVRLPGGPVAA